MAKIAPALDIEDFDELETELIEAGYETGAPRGADVDRDIVASTICAECGHRMVFAPFMRFNGLGERRSYRAFAVCMHCNKASEF